MSQVLRHRHKVAGINETHGDYVVIRGNRLYLDSLVDKNFFETDSIAALRDQFLNASPFSYLVIDGLFNSKLLELVHAEFDLFNEGSWRDVVGTHEKTHRSPPKPILGPATQIYFSIVNSGWFIDFISSISGIQNLIPDPQLYGGGMHETRQGGHFGIHSDFNLHHKTMLHNEMIITTYLNKGWEKKYNGALELWDANTGNCTAEIVPEFGRTLLMRHGLLSLHGHSKPLSTDENMKRRSVAAYYFTNQTAEKLRPRRHSTKFFPTARTTQRFRLLYTLKYKILPSFILKIPFIERQTIKKVLPAPMLAVLRKIKLLVP